MSGHRQGDDAQARPCRGEWLPQSMRHAHDRDFAKSKRDSALTMLRSLFTRRRPTPSRPVSSRPSCPHGFPCFLYLPYMLTRDQALALMQEWTPSESLRKHMYAVELGMRAMATQAGV